jgi:predicted lipid-binding transport protein (Tim44 family)
LKQVDQELQSIADDLKKVSNVSAKPKKAKQTQVKKKQPKQPKQQQQQQQEDDFEDEMPAEGETAGDGLLASMTGGLMAGLQLLLTHRAVILFGATAFAIYTQGEMASV